HDVAAMAGGEFQRGGHAVGLHGGGVASEQAGGFGRMWSEQGGGLPRVHHPLQDRVGGEQIERVGIEDQRQLAAQRPGEQGGCLGGLAKAGAYRQRGELRGQLVGRAQHQLRAQRVHRRGVRVEQGGGDRKSV